MRWLFAVYHTQLDVLKLGILMHLWHCDKTAMRLSKSTEVHVHVDLYQMYL